MSEADLDRRVRAAAFDFLRAQTSMHGEVLPFALLSKGFELEGRLWQSVLERWRGVGRSGVAEPPLPPA